MDIRDLSMILIKKTHVIQIILITASIFTIYFSLISTIPLINHTRLKAIDFYFQLQSGIYKPPEEIDRIAIIAIDDDSQRLLNVRWPWKRTFFVPILERLNLYKPRVTYLNFSFVGETPGEEITDALFVQAIKESKNIIIPSLIDKDGKLQLPYKPILDAVAKTGFSNKILDADSIIRSQRLYYKEQYPIEISILSQYTGKMEKELIESIPEKENIAQINFLANPNKFNTYSLIDLINERIPKEALEDKIVLVGTTAQIAMDIFSTPTGSMPGIYLTADTLLMHMSKKYISEPDPLWKYAITIILMLSIGLITFKIGPLRGLFILVFLSIALFIIGYSLYNIGIILDYFNPMLAITLNFIFIGFLRHMVQLEEKIIALNLANIEIKKAQQEIIRREQLSTIGRLTSQILHEFSNPIGNLISCLGMLTKKIEKTHELKEYVEDAYSEVNRMSQISKQLKSSYTPHFENPVPEDVNKLLTEVIESTRYKMQDKGITLDKTLAPVPNVLASAEKLKQVFLNMILNAIDATSQGGRIEISSKLAGDGFIDISFKDNGCGIPKEDLPKVFTAFYTTKKGGEGSGLGLFICYEIIKAHKGQINVESEAGKGTTFTIRLPIKAIPEF